MLSSGFTLLETLVALTIVAVCFAVAFRALPEGLGAQDRARRLETATSLAQSLLAQSTPGHGTENAFAWRVETGPPVQSGDIGGQVVRATVNWVEAGNDRGISLQTFRIGTLPRPP